MVFKKCGPLVRMLKLEFDFRHIEIFHEFQSSHPIVYRDRVYFLKHKIDPSPPSDL